MSKKCVCGNEMTREDWKHEWVCHRCGRKKPFPPPTMFTVFMCRKCEHLLYVEEDEDFPQKLGKIAASQNSMTSCERRSSMSEYIKLEEVLEIAEQQGHVTLDDLLSCDTLSVTRCGNCQKCLIDLSPAGHHLCMRRPIRERVLLTDFCSHGLPMVTDESESR